MNAQGRVIILSLCLFHSFFTKFLSKDCTSEPAVGKCKALVKQFYYDPKTNTCKVFNWGGCPVVGIGNRNRYNTKEECEKVCLKSLKPDCSSEPATGICKAAIQPFYYDPTTQTWKKFIFGGCSVEGNRNNYETVNECENFKPKYACG